MDKFIKTDFLIRTLRIFYTNLPNTYTMAFDLSTVTKELEKMKKQIDTLLKKITPEESADAAPAEKKKPGRKPKATVVKTNPDESADDASATKTTPAESADDAPAPKPKGTKAKTTESPPKRIPRLTPTTKAQIKDACTTNGAPYDDKFPKEFSDRINNMSKDDFEKCDLSAHMKEFAISKIPQEGGGGAADNSAPPPKASRAKAQGSSNAAGGGPKSATPTLLELTKLQADKTLKETTVIGVYENGAGKKFTGPLEEEDEDMDDCEFDSNNYVVGNKSGRMYAVDASGGPDVFVGYKGVGKFKDA
jgi:hypothetical protein